MRGVTSVVLDRVFARCISTHTPHVRRDGMKLQAMMERQEFQLTRLMRGVTNTYSAIIMQLQGFQLKRLMRGVTFQVVLYVL